MRAFEGIRSYNREHSYLDHALRALLPMPDSISMTPNFLVRIEGVGVLCEPGPFHRNSKTLGGGRTFHIDSDDHLRLTYKFTLFNEKPGRVKSKIFLFPISFICFVVNVRLTIKRHI